MHTVMQPSSPVAAHAPGQILIRTLAAEDSIADLTALLHRAYKPQVEMGLRPLAGRQSEEVTRARSSSGECFVALNRDRIVGTILFQETEDAKFPAFFLKPGVTHFSLLAVDPTAQGRGIGRLLIDTVARRALEVGAGELACSMAEPDTRLMEFYLRLGFRFVEHWQWPYTNYRSAILSRRVE